MQEYALSGAGHWHGESERDIARRYARTLDSTLDSRSKEALLLPRLEAEVAADSAE